MATLATTQQHGAHPSSLVAREGHGDLPNSSQQLRNVYMGSYQWDDCAHLNSAKLTIDK